MTDNLFSCYCLQMFSKVFNSLRCRSNSRPLNIHHESVELKLQIKCNDDVWQYKLQEIDQHTFLKYRLKGEESSVCTRLIAILESINRSAWNSLSRYFLYWSASLDGFHFALRSSKFFKPISKDTPYSYSFTKKTN
jgi:hypothetical protein